MKKEKVIPILFDQLGDFLYNKIMKTQIFATIPKDIAKMGELVVLPRKEFERIIEARLEEQELLQLSREAKSLRKEGKLPVLRSLRDLR